MNMHNTQSLLIERVLTISEYAGLLSHCSEPGKFNIVTIQYLQKTPVDKKLSSSEYALLETFVCMFIVDPHRGYPGFRVYDGSS